MYRRQQNTIIGTKDWDRKGLEGEGSGRKGRNGFAPRFIIL